MKPGFFQNVFPSYLFPQRTIRATTMLVLFLIHLSASAVTKTSQATGNWSASGTWNPAGMPANGDDVIIHGGNVVTVDGAYTCHNLDIGDATSGVTTVTVSGVNGLTINGDLRINPSNKANTYTLAAAAGTVNVAGTFSTWGTTNTNTLSVSTGTITFTPAVTIANAAQNITYTGAGVINFNSNYTDNVNKLVTFAGCTANFAGNYTVGTTNESWAAKGTANFTGTGSISPNANITFNNIQVGGTASTTLNSGAGVVVIAGTYTLASGSSFAASQNFEVQGNWTNNGGTYSGTNTVWMNGAAQTIGGTSSTTFYTLQMGSSNSAVTVACTVGINTNCNSLVFHSAANARTLTISNGFILTVNGDVTLNQATAAVTNTLAVNGGTCTVSGNLNFTGVNNTATWITKVAVTTGAFTLTGNVNWMSNTAVATEVIALSGAGSITFGSPLTMGSGSGTLSSTSTGTINFNGTTSTSFVFGGATAPVLTTSGACFLNFKDGFTNNTNALVFGATSTATFNGNGSITPNAAITFGIASINANDTLVNGGTIVTVAGAFTLANGSAFLANQSFEVDGNWTNNGGTLTATNDTITLNGAAQTISGSALTAFPSLQIGNPTGAIAVAVTMNNNNSCANLMFSANTKARTLTLGAGTTLTASGNLTINQATALANNTLAVNAATCKVSGNLAFVGTTNTATWIAKIAVTTGSFTLGGTITWMANTAVATEVITVTTGTLTFNSPVSMPSGSGTISVTSTGTINFNGTSAASLTFGGVATVPVLTTTLGCKLYFANGLINNTNTLTLIAGSLATFTGNGAITPNAAIVFGNVEIDGTHDTLNTAASTALVKGSFTLIANSAFVLNQNLEIQGNWVNNGGVITDGIYSIMMNGAAQTMGGTSSTTFGTLQIGSPNNAITVVCTMNTNTTCSNLVFHAGANARTFTITGGDTLSVSSNVTINQPAAAVTNTLAVNAGACTISGNLNFTGVTNTATWVSKVAVTTGSLNVAGTVNWMANTLVATEVISVTTGTLTFGTSLTMGQGSGTLSVTGAATVNFNGSTAPSFNFGGAATSPVFTTAAGCKLNFANGFTNNSVALTITAPSTTTFTGTGTLTPNFLVTFGDVVINNSTTLTLAGAIALKGNWTDNGTLVTGTNLVTFNAASPSVQTITRSGGETFYSLTASTAGDTIKMANDVMVTNTLTMSGANINMNGNTLTLGNSATATLTRTAGTAYNGTWKRWFPAVVITSNSGSYYGLFPIGSATDYRPLAIASATTPTTPGYVSASHTDALSITLVTYTDNEPVTIQAISDMKFNLSASGSLNGTYSLTASFTGFANVGVTTDLKLLTYTSATMGSVGTFSATTGTVINPNVIRTSLTAAQLTNVWVIGTHSSTNTPLRQYYYSRKTGNWSDVTVGNSTWSYTAGGAGASCNCTPSSTAYVVISSSNTVTVDVNSTVDYLDISTGGTLTDNGTATFAVNKDFNLYGVGIFAATSSWSVTGKLNLSSTSTPTSTGTFTAGNKLNIPAGGTLMQSTGTLTLGSDVNIDGTLILGTAGCNLTGSGTVISGTGSVTGVSGSVLTISNNKSLLTGASLTFGTNATAITVALNGALTLTNNGTVKIYGDLTGTVAGSTWVNAANSTLEVTGNLLSTGTLTASASPNTVNYSGSGAQTIKTPSTGYYSLLISNAGTKSLASSTSAANAVTIQNAAILDESTFALTGAAALNMIGTSQLKLQRSASATYPELTGTYTLTSGTVSINQTVGTASIASAGYYNLSFTGSSPYDMSGVSGIANNFYVQGSSSLINGIALTVTDSFNYASSASTQLNDNLLAGSLTISAGTLDDGGNSITVNGAAGWNLNGGAFTSTGTVYLTGTAAQNISGSLPTSFNNLVINNANGITLNVSPAAATVIAGTLTMSKGILYTTAANILRVLDNASCTNGSAISYVSGPMVKVGNDNFNFPIGKSGRWRRAGISDITDPTTEVTAEYFATPYSDLAHETGLLYGVSPVEYWTIDRQVSADSLRLTLFWENAAASNIKDCSKITIAHYKSSQWNEEHATAVGGSVCTGTGTGSIQTTGFISSFSPFTFGGYTDDALPISLVSFAAEVMGNEVQTKWATRLELNNAYFTVERSADGENFSAVGKVDGAGNSTSLLNYELMDETPLQGISYYRLRQTDFNGKYTFSDIVSVNIEAKKADPKIILYPNPAHNEVFIRISDMTGQFEFKIFDMAGREVLNRIINLDGSGDNQTASISLEGILNPGLYVVTGNTSQAQFKEKLVVR